jgi:hypothetical protein
MTAPRLPCVCGCPQGRHLMGRRDCRSCQTCSEYEPDAQAEASPEPSESVVLDVGALLGEVQDDVSREDELAARLAEVKAELARVQGELAKRPSEADWTAFKSERARLRKAVAMPGPALASSLGVLLFAYDAWQCLGGSVNCSRRYFADDPDHGCGPLTPVTVTVSRRTPP